MTDTLQAALYSIPADDRDTWVTMAMAIKSELGDGGFELWDSWSWQSDRYKAADAKAVWRSVKPTGGITISTLYQIAKENGWQGEAPVVVKQPDPEQEGRRAEQAAAEEAIRQRSAERATKVATKMLQRPS